MTTRFAKSPDFVSMLSSIAGPDYGKMGNHAQQMQGSLSRAALNADSAARQSEIEAQGIIDAGGYQAQAAAAQAGGGGGGFGDILGQVAGIASGFAGGGGVGGFGGSVNTPGFGMNPSTQTAFGSGGGSVSGYGTFGPNWGFPSS